MDGARIAIGSTHPTPPLPKPIKDSEPTPSPSAVVVILSSRTSNLAPIVIAGNDPYTSTIILLIITGSGKKDKKCNSRLSVG